MGNKNLYVYVIWVLMFLKYNWLYKLQPQTYKWINFHKPFFYSEYKNIKKERWFHSHFIRQMEQE